MGPVAMSAVVALDEDIVALPECAGVSLREFREIGVLRAVDVFRKLPRRVGAGDTVLHWTGSSWFFAPVSAGADGVDGSMECSVTLSTSDVEVVDIRIPIKDPV